MPYVLLNGWFYVVGFQPDGDSIRFQAANNGLWASLRGRQVRLNRDGMAQLRLEGIDALEVHFGRNTHQNLQWAHAARNELLRLAGFAAPVFAGNEVTSVTTANGSNEWTEGFILARETDGNGRPIAFAFAGAPPAAYTNNPMGVHLIDDDAFRRCFNYQLLAGGFVYPTFYFGMVAALRNAFSTATVAARAAGQGIWQLDRTHQPGVDPTLGVLQGAVLLPKLFRRIVAWLEIDDRSVSFRDYLDSLNERILVLATGDTTHFSTVVHEQRQGDVTTNIRLVCQPEAILFID